jgi:vacuolar-type H+-ATPase subunit I/STV1
MGRYMEKCASPIDYEKEKMGSSLAERKSSAEDREQHQAEKVWMEDWDFKAGAFLYDLFRMNATTTTKEPSYDRNSNDPGDVIEVVETTKEESTDIFVVVPDGEDKSEASKQEEETRQVRHISVYSTGSPLMRATFSYTQE